MMALSPTGSARTCRATTSYNRLALAITCPHPISLIVIDLYRYDCYGVHFVGNRKVRATVTLAPRTTPSSCRPLSEYKRRMRMRAASDHPVKEGTAPQFFFGEEVLDGIE